MFYGFNLKCSNNCMCKKNIKEIFYDNTHNGICKEKGKYVPVFN
jgi:hypothetical protein